MTPHFKDILYNNNSRNIIIVSIINEQTNLINENEVFEIA